MTLARNELGYAVEKGIDDALDLGIRIKLTP
jgi:hypothetical protein